MEFFFHIFNSSLIFRNFTIMCRAFAFFFILLGILQPHAICLFHTSAPLMRLWRPLPICSPSAAAFTCFSSARGLRGGGSPPQATRGPRSPHSSRWGLVLSASLSTQTHVQYVCPLITASLFRPSARHRWNGATLELVFVICVTFSRTNTKRSWKEQIPSPMSSWHWRSPFREKAAGEVVWWAGRGTRGWASGGQGRGSRRERGHCTWCANSWTLSCINSHRSRLPVLNLVRVEPGPGRGGSREGLPGGSPAPMAPWPPRSTHLARSSLGLPPPGPPSGHTSLIPSSSSQN